MKKFVCTVCGYVYEGEKAPEVCPICKAPAEKFKEQTGEKVWAAEHVVGVFNPGPRRPVGVGRAEERLDRLGPCGEAAVPRVAGVHGDTSRRIFICIF